MNKKQEWKVRYVNYPLQFRLMEKELMGTIYHVLSNGDLILRQQLRDFESNFAKFLGCKYVVSVGNCTDGLLLSLMASGIKPGDEVITVSHTFVATAEVIKMLGAKPVFVDVEEDHNMDISLMEGAITPKTKAVMPVHLNGRVCAMDELLRITGKYGLPVIEDSAQAVGAMFKGKKGGTFGVTGCYSFYPAKLLGAFGDAGAVATNSEDMAEKLFMLRDHGRGKKGEIEIWGLNCRMDNLHAALLDIKLKRVEGWITRRRRIAEIYHSGLKDLSVVRLPVPPKENDDHYDVFQNYEIEAENRDTLRECLTDKCVETMLPWGGKAIHQFSGLRFGHIKLPRTEKLFQGVLLLPMYPELEDGQIKYVVETIRDFYKK